MTTKFVFPENLRKGDVVGVPEAVIYTVLSDPRIENGLVRASVRYIDGGLAERVWPKAFPPIIPVLKA